jgi:hypothetical protein
MRSPHPAAGEAYTNVMQPAGSSEAPPAGEPRPAALTTVSSPDQSLTTKP